MKNIAVCQSGFSSLLEEELLSYKNTNTLLKTDSAVVFAGNIPSKTAFPHYICGDVSEISGSSVNNIAGAVFDYFINANKDCKIEDSWHALFIGEITINGLSRRISNVMDAFEGIIKKRMSRVSKMMNLNERPEIGNNRGLFVYFYEFDKIMIGTDFLYNGQRRMADDSQAPSRSYLKVEEAYGVLGYEPGEYETVADLGAAPGGWSYSAAKRKAEVTAIDNGPLKGGAKENIYIKHLKADAFKYMPDKRVEWLYCDMVEEPHRVIELIEKWFENRKCTYYIINLKFGHVNPIKLIEEIKKNSIISATEYKLIHLYHDRDEFTITGIVKQ